MATQKIHCPLCPAHYKNHLVDMNSKRNRNHLSCHHFLHESWVCLFYFLTMLCLNVQQSKLKNTTKTCKKGQDCNIVTAFNKDINRQRLTAYKPNKMKWSLCEWTGFGTGTGSGLSDVDADSGSKSVPY